MAVTPVGNPYVESSDLVANYPGVSEALAERIDVVGVNPFADSAARATAIPSPTEGMMSSLNDTDAVERYDGATWKPVGGKVLQVVSAEYTTSTATTSATYVTTGLTASMTPSATSSKIMVMCYTTALVASANIAEFTIFRGTVAGTNLATGSGIMVRFGNVAGMIGGVSLTRLDSPATTSAVAYNMAFKTLGGMTATVQQLNSSAQIILIEVAA